MTIVQILKECKAQGVRLAASRGDLIVKSSASAIRPDLRSALKENKQEILEYLNSLAETAPTDSARAVTRAPSQSLPLSPYQRMFWQGAQTSGDTEAAAITHTIIEAFDHDEQISPQRLKEALLWTALRHDMLRIVFTADDEGGLIQTVEAGASVELVVHDADTECPAQSPPEERRDITVQRLIAKLMASPLRLPGKMPFRCGLVTGGGAGCTIILCLPHILGDAASFDIILRDVLSHLGGRTAKPAATQYLDFAAWSETRDPESDSGHERYWKGVLKNAPPVHPLPTDFVRAVNRKPPAFDFLVTDFAWPEEARDFMRQRKITPFVFLYTAMQITLLRFGGSNETPTIVPMANRHRFPGADTCVGCFANETATYFPLDPDVSVEAAVKAVRDGFLGVLEHQDFPFQEVIKSNCPDRSPDWLPLAQLYFSYLRLSEGLPVRHRFQHITGLPYELSFVIAEKEEGLRLMLGYDATLFSGETAARLAELFVAVCRAMAGQSRRALKTLKDLDLSGGREKKEVPESTLGALFADADLVFDEGPPSIARFKETLCAGNQSEAGGRAEQVLVTCAAFENRKAAAPAGTKFCLLNHLPHAKELSELHERLGDGWLVLEIPGAAAGEASRWASASLASFRDLRPDARFAEFFLAGAAPAAAAAGERLFMGGVSGLYRGGNVVALPLPSMETDYIWYNGYGFNLDELAACWSRELGGIPVALSCAPSRLSGGKQRRMIAWTVHERSALEHGVPLSAVVPGAPDPDDGITISALPLTGLGALDRGALSRLPLFSEAYLKEVEKAVSGPERPDLFLRLQPRPATEASRHIAELLPETEAVRVRDRYIAIEPEDTVTEADEGATLSLLCGPSERIPFSFSFPEYLENIRTKRFVFTGLEGPPAQYSGADLLERANVVLAGLQERGITPGSPAIIYCSKEEEILPLAWACLLGGICMTALLPPFAGQSETQIHARLTHMHTILGRPPIIANREEPAPVDGAVIIDAAELFAGHPGGRDTAPPRPSYYATKPDTPIYTAFTSGSTGIPKAARLSAKHVLSSIHSLSETYGPIPDEVILAITPLDHVGSIFGHSFHGVVRGSAQVYCPFARVLSDPLIILDLIHTHRVSHTWAPDFVWRLLHQALQESPLQAGRWDLSCLNHIMCGGESTRESTFANLHSALAPFGFPEKCFRHCWGMSETSAMFTMSDFWSPGQAENFNGIVDAGGPMRGSAFRVVDKHGQVLPEGRIGSFQVRGEQVITEYYNNPEATLEGFSPDGWFITGDLAMIRQGRIIFCGREKEQIVISGQNISQFDIESSVDAIEGVESSYSVVLGCRNTDARREDIIVLAHVESGDPAVRRSVTRKIRETIARQYGITPTHVLLVEKSDVPKAALGKIQRTVMLKRFIKGEYQEYVQESDLIAGNGQAVPQWFSARGWTPGALPPPSLQEQRRFFANTSVIVAGTGKRLADLVAAKLESGGCLHVDNRAGASANAGATPADPPGGRTGLFPEANGAGNTVIYLLGRERPAPGLVSGLTPGALYDPEWVERELVPLCEFLRQAAAGGQKFRLIVATVRGQQAREEDTPEPGAAAAYALVSCFARTTGNKSLVVDCEGVCGEDDAFHLLHEITGESSDVLSAWRNGRRLIPVLASAELQQDGRGSGWDRPFSSDCFTVCTGMTGHVGTLLLPELLALTRGNFLLLGNRDPREALALFSGPEFREDWGNRVLYVRTPIDDRERVASAIGEAASFFSKAHGSDVVPGGILHLAASHTGETALADAAPELVRQMLDQAARHIETLHAAFADAGGRGPRMCFSSPISFWGGSGTALYGTMCEFKNAILRRLNSHATSRDDAWHCLSFSRWEKPDAGEDHISDIIKARGFATIPPRQGAISLLAMLRRACAGEKRLLNAGINENALAVSAFMRRPSCVVHPLCRLEVYGDMNGNHARMRGELEKYLGYGAKPAFSGSLRDANDEQQTAEQPGTALIPGNAERRMQAVWSKVLQKRSIDPALSFFELGGTSMHVPHLRREVQKEFGVDIGNVGVFAHPSVRDMANALGAMADSGNGKPQTAAMARSEKQRNARRARR